MNRLKTYRQGRKTINFWQSPPFFPKSSSTGIHLPIPLPSQTYPSPSIDANAPSPPSPLPSPSSICVSLADCPVRFSGVRVQITIAGKRPPREKQKVRVGTKTVYVSQARLDRGSWPIGRSRGVFTTVAFFRSGICTLAPFLLRVRETFESAAHR